MKKIVIFLLTAMLSVAAFGAAADSAPLRVMTSFYPLHVFAQNILKDVKGVELTNLTHPSTGCLHDYQLLASDMRGLSQADMLIINGGGMESFLDTAMAQFPNLEIVDSSKGIDLLPAGFMGAGHGEEEHDAHPEEAPGASVPAQEDDEHHDEVASGTAAEGDHGEEAGHDEGTGHDEAADHDGEDHHDEEAGHDHDHGEYNAHIWLDPRNAKAMTLTIAEALAERLPDQADLIHQNAQAYADKLLALHEELAQALSGLARRDIVTFHEAFPYFAQAYGLNVVAVVALEPEEALTPAMVSELVDKVRAYGLPPLFTEPQYEDRAARAVAQETGAPVYELDPIVTGDGAPDAYERGMRRNAETLKEALGGK